LVVGAPPSFEQLIDLPDPIKLPAYYASAVDTIGLTNVRLAAHTYSANQILQEQHVKDLVKAWRAKYPNEKRYPLPPDKRTLYVKADGAHPTESGALLWTRACKEFRNLSSSLKVELLHMMRGEHVHWNSEKKEGTNKLYMRFFLRYMVWREHVEVVNTPSVQPSRGEMQELFNLPILREKVRRWRRFSSTSPTRAMQRCCYTGSSTSLNTILCLTTNLASRSRESIVPSPEIP
jgi:hypothetical protein